jgi:hypothetical protein
MDTPLGVAGVWCCVAVGCGLFGVKFSALAVSSPILAESSSRLSNELSVLTSQELMNLDSE